MRFVLSKPSFSRARRWAALLAVALMGALAAPLGFGGQGPAGEVPQGPAGGGAQSLAALLRAIFQAPEPPALEVEYNDDNYVAPRHEVSVVPIEELIEKLRLARKERLSAYIEDRFRVSRAKAARVIQQVERHAETHAIEVELVLAIIAVESTFRDRAVSSAGARGLMQVLPRAHPNKVRRIGGVKALFDPGKNIALGIQILSGYLELSGGDLRQALLRYNGSLANPRSRYADKVLRLAGEMREATLPVS